MVKHYYDELDWSVHPLLGVYLDGNLVEEIDLRIMADAMADEMDIDYDRLIIGYNEEATLYDTSGNEIDTLQLDEYAEDYLSEMGYEIKQELSMPASTKEFVLHSPNQASPINKFISDEIKDFVLHADSTIMPMSKPDTKHAELNTTPIMNIFFQASQKGDKYDTKIMRKYSVLLSWYRRLDTVNELTKNKELTRLLDFKPLYYVTYEYRNAVWGFRFENKPVVLYNSKKGLSIQVSPDADTGYCKRLIDALYDRLVHEDTEKEIMDLIGTMEERYNAYTPYIPYPDDSGEYDVYLPLSDEFNADDDPHDRAAKYNQVIHGMIKKSYDEQVSDDDALRDRIKSSFEEANAFGFDDQGYYDAIDECIADYDYDSMIKYLQGYYVSNLTSSFFDCFDTDTADYRIPDDDTVENYVWRYIGTLIDEDAWTVYNDSLVGKDLGTLYNTSDVWMELCEGLDFEEQEHIPRSATEFKLNSPSVNTVQDSFDALPDIDEDVIRLSSAYTKKFRLSAPTDKYRMEF